MSGLNQTAARQGGVLSRVCSYTTFENNEGVAVRGALSAGETWTSEWEQTAYPDVAGMAYSDVAGTWYFEFANNRRSGVVSRFPVAGFDVDAGITEFHNAVKLPRWFRVVYVNGNADQSAFELYIYYGQFRQGNAPLNQALNKDVDAIVTRTVGSEVDIALGRFNGFSVNDKFGIYNSVGTTLTDIWSVGGIHQWPTSAIALEVLSASTNDTSAGSGARAIQIDGLDANWNEQSAIVVMNGTSVVPVTGYTWMRVNRVRVVSRGTYLSANAGAITVRISSGGATMAQVPVDAKLGGIGTTQMTHYTIPANKIGLLSSYIVNVENSKPSTIYGRIRTNADNVTAPISGALFPPIEIRGAEGVFERNSPYPYVIPEKTDLWTQAYADTGTTGFVSVNYKVILVDTD